MTGHSVSESGAEIMFLGVAVFGVAVLGLIALAVGRARDAVRRIRARRRDGST